MESWVERGVERECPCWAGESESPHLVSPLVWSPARIFGGITAPSTLGTYLRSFTHGHVQQLDAVGARVLAGLTEQAPGLIAGAEHTEGLAFLDVDDTIREVHGYAKQGAAYVSVSRSAPARRRLRIP